MNKYNNHDILAHDVLDEPKEKEFFDKLRLRLRRVRKELKMTQREFGETAEVDRRYVAKVECGSQNPSFKLLRNLSIRHKISMDWLLYGIGTMYVRYGDENYGKELAEFKKFLENAADDDIDVVMTMVKKII